jgi:AcrR family transcriptional regulator
MITISRDDWADAALTIFAEHGMAAVDAAQVAAALGVPEDDSRDHFPDRDDLVRAALDRWRTYYTEGSIAMLKEVDDPRECLRVLLGTALSDWAGTPFDRAALADHSSPLVATALRAVHDVRLDFITEQYERMGFPSAVARSRAVVAYAASLGLIGLRPEYGEKLGFDLDDAIDLLVTAPS